jgi:hypothetical protein
MAWCWIGVGFEYPAAVNAARRGRESPRSEKSVKRFDAFQVGSLISPFTADTGASAFGYRSYLVAAAGADLRKIVLGCDWALTRLLCAATQASAASFVSKPLTIVGFVSGIETFTPKPSASSDTTS